MCDVGVLYWYVHLVVLEAFAEYQKNVGHMLFLDLLEITVFPLFELLESL